MNSESVKKKRIGVIHAVLGSAAPLTKVIREVSPDTEVLNFVNEEMLSYVNRNGGVDAIAMRMFANQVFHAEEAGVDAIVIACNVFAARADAVEPFVSVPVITVDSAMQEKAAAIGGRIGVMGTNHSAVPACCAGIRRAADKAGLPIPEIVNGTVTEAAAALSGGDTGKFDSLLTERALELVNEGCGAIVLSQVTMARAKAAMQRAGISVPILTSPEECAKRLASLWK